MCGGTGCFRFAMLLELGLSPRVRGNRLHVLIEVLPPRSIPACAGEPSSFSLSSAAIRVYPRVCGGTLGSWVATPVVTGLSPRVRGNPNPLPCSIGTSGSIPACAGEPAGVSVVVLLETVYPRVCGGTTALEGGIDINKGLSPRVRGNQFLSASVRGVSGSIPACAGEPIRQALLAKTSTVYPRVCGGTRARYRICTLVLGLSPRVRGNPIKSPTERAFTGSIPACAGEPPSHHPICNG